MITSLLAVLAMSNGVVFCDDAAHNALQKINSSSETTVAKKEAKAEPTLETRVNELGDAVKNLTAEISQNTKRGAKTADARMRKEFETIKKGLTEATNTVEAKAKETGTEASAELKTALEKLSRSIDELAQKIAR